MNKKMFLFLLVYRLLLYCSYSVLIHNNRGWEMVEVFLFIHSPFTFNSQNENETRYGRKRIDVIAFVFRWETFQKKNKRLFNCVYFSCVVSLCIYICSGDVKRFTTARESSIKEIRFAIFFFFLFLLLLLALFHSSFTNDSYIVFNHTQLSWQESFVCAWTVFLDKTYDFSTNLALFLYK